VVAKKKGLLDDDDDDHDVKVKEKEKEKAVENKDDGRRTTTAAAVAFKDLKITNSPEGKPTRKKNGTTTDDDWDTDPDFVQPQVDKKPVGGGGGGGGAAGPSAATIMNDEKFVKYSQGTSGVQHLYQISIDDVGLHEMIGEGSFGVVVRGVYCGKDVAVKKLKPKKSQLDDFLKEAELLASLRHPNIVLLMGVCLDAQRKECWIVTELLQSNSVEKCLLDKSIVIDWKTKGKILEQTAQGMAYLHKRNILHRDLKPANLLCDEAFNIKICDFGVSKLKDNKMTGEIGSPSYMAPELMMQGNYGEEVDIYSYGISIWEVLTREEVYPQYKTAMTVMAAVVRGERPPIPHDCPPIYSSLMTACWSSNPADRPKFEVMLQQGVFNQIKQLRQ
jgi:tRNA A-37 threonylcarbamoyl transferase component Bud32